MSTETTNEKTRTTTTARTCSPNKAQPPPKKAPSLPAGLTAVVGEEPEQDGAEDAADEVDGDDVERVVVAEPVLQLDGEEAHSAGEQRR